MEYANKNKLMFVDFNKFIEETNNCKTIDEAFSLWEQELSVLGFDRVVYSLMTDHMQLDKKAGHAIIGNYPEDWMKYYVEKGYEDVDPVRKRIMVGGGAFTWDSLSDNYRKLSKEESTLMNEASDAKLLDGVGLSLSNPLGEIVGMGFASSSGKIGITPYHLSAINLLATQFHTVFSKIECKKDISVYDISLTPREKEVLQWCKEGKSNTDIATIMGISRNTVSYYFKNIFKKLGVNSRLLAVTKSTNLQIIT